MLALPGPSREDSRDRQGVTQPCKQKPPPIKDQGNLVEVENLKKWFPVQQGVINTLLAAGKIDYVRAIDGISFNIRRGEVLGSGRRERQRQDHHRQVRAQPGYPHRGLGAF